MAAQGAARATAAVTPEVPYSRSWLDRLILGIDRLPIPAVAAYPLLLAALVLLINALGWLEGRHRPGTLDPYQSGYAVYSVYMLAMLHYLNNVARAKIEAFRSVLNIDAAEYEKLRYELTTLPPLPATLAAVGGFGFVAVAFITEPPSVGAHPLAIVARFLIEGATLALLAVLLYHTVHQLRVVSRLHALASRIDLFEPAPLHAFSQLTAYTGVGLVVLTAYSFLLDPSLDVSDVGLLALVASVAVAAFVLPLEGMHERIVAEKERLQREADQRFMATVAQLHRAVDEQDLAVADGLNKLLRSLQIERDALAQLSTWPWQPATLRGFASALVLPVVLWLIVRALERSV